MIGLWFIRGRIIYIEIGRVLLYDYNLVSVSNRYEVVIYISLGVFLFLTSYSYSLVVSSSVVYISFLPRNSVVSFPSTLLHIVVTWKWFVSCGSVILPLFL